jgi:thymidylate kinase
MSDNVVMYIANTPRNALKEIQAFEKPQAEEKQQTYREEKQQTYREEEGEEEERLVVVPSAECIDEENMSECVQFINHQLCAIFNDPAHPVQVSDEPSESFFVYVCVV